MMTRGRASVPASRAPGMGKTEVATSMTPIRSDGMHPARRRCTAPQGAVIRLSWLWYDHAFNANTTDATAHLQIHASRIALIIG